MTCEETIERLPWLLNGTLEEEERRQVEAHLQACGDCRRALADTRLAWQVFDQHPTPEELIAFAGDEPASGLLSAPLSERVAEHLASCPPCAGELELVSMSRRLAELEGAGEPGGAAGPGSVALFAPPAARSSRSPSPAGPPPPAPSGLRRPTGRVAGGAWRRPALAAGLATVVAAAGWLHGAGRLADLRSENQGLRSENRQLQDVEHRLEHGLAGASFVEVYPSHLATRGEAAAKVVDAGAPLTFLWLFRTRGTWDCEVRNAVFSGQKGSVFVEASRLDNNHILQVPLASGRLEPGDYMVVVREAPPCNVQESYQLRVKAAAPPGPSPTPG